MAEDFGGFESFAGAPGGKEKAQESDEQFSERYRQAQAAIKKIKQEEQRKKQDDNTLAGTIVQFLNDPAHTQMFMFISKLVGVNIPSDLILAIIALIHEPSRKLIEEKFTENYKKLDSPHKPDASKESKSRIDDWINKIYVVASAEPHRVLETTCDHDKKVNPTLIQFAAMVLREFLESEEKKEANFENLQSFCAAFLKKLLDQLSTQVDFQGLLKESDEKR